MNRKLECFAAAAQEGNFSRAAQSLYISQQALSDAIARLEAEYGVLLFERRPRLRLTPAGEELLVRARAILRMEREAERAMTEIARLGTGRIRLGISQLRARAFFPAIWERFHAACPRVQLFLSEVNSARMEEMLLNDSIDLYIGLEFSSNPAIRRESIGTEGQVCLFAEKLIAGLPQRDREKILRWQKEGMKLCEFAELASFPYILPAQTRMRRNLDSYFNEKHLVPLLAVESNSLSATYALCRQGTAVGITSQIGLPREWYEDPSLFVLPITDESLMAKMCLASRSDREMPDYLREFAALAREVIADLYHSGSPA